MPRPAIARITELKVEGYRVLRDVTLSNITPFTTLIGPNGSGKSTLFDVFAFLAESMSSGLRPAWDQRGRFKDLRSRGYEGPLRFEITYENSSGRKLRYVLAIDETSRGPVVIIERL